MKNHTITFDDWFKPEAIEAMLAAVEYGQRGRDTKLTFIKGIAFGVVGYDADGEPGYTLDFLGGARMLEMLGMLHTMPIWYMQGMPGSPLCDDDPDDD